jgi:hypothetical protein
MKRPPDISTLHHMLTFRRPHGSDGEAEFLRRFIPGDRDGFGNRIVDVGPDPPVTLFSSHVDTVHATDGRQRIHSAGGIISLRYPSPSRCLGADDTVGVWIMLHMIRNGIPGRYVFHRGEEVGCLGSSWIAENAPETLDGIRHAVAFDRAGYDSIVTHQMGRRTASDEFARALAGYLEGYAPDPGGVYTDTERYEHLVPECTNLSVGYSGQHGPRETQDAEFAAWLAWTVLIVPWADLPTERDPETPPGPGDAPWWQTYRDEDDEEPGWEDTRPAYGEGETEACETCFRTVRPAVDLYGFHWSGGILCADCARDLDVLYT